MDINNIPIVVASRNEAAAVHALLEALRPLYGNPVYIVDCSEPAEAAATREAAARFGQVEYVRFGDGRHRGPAMAWAVRTLPLGQRAWFLAPHAGLVRPGLLEQLDRALPAQAYGAGAVRRLDGPDAGMACLDDACCLVNIDVMRRWPLPTRHAAPFVLAMRAIGRAGQAGDLLRHADAAAGAAEWRADRDAAPARADAPPEVFNRDLLQLISPQARHVMEIGCNTGTLARAYRAANPWCAYTGVEIDEPSVDHARDYCDMAFNLDVETAEDAFFEAARDCDHWIFGDVLEHLRDPWGVLRKIRRVLPEDGCVLACIPNVQHWSVQARINIGHFVYEPNGLLDRTHLRWFTRKTVVSMFEEAGYRVELLRPRVFDEPARERYMPAIALMAKLSGADVEEAVRDASALQYVVRAVPA